MSDVACKRWCGFVVLATVLCVASSSWAAITLPAVIGDHMVLQAGKKVNIWGKADAGKTIVVKLAKTQRKTVVGSDGNWSVSLRPPKAGGPYEMSVSDGADTVTIKDILVGEVWVCSGQSNMEWPVKSSNNAEQEQAQANYPQIRLFMVAHAVAAEPAWDVQGKWMVCTPETVPDFSAVGYFFGRMLHKELGRPVGLIKSAWGGTPAESWTTMATLQTQFQPIVKKWETNLAEYPVKKAEYDKQLPLWEKARDEAKANAQNIPPKPVEPRGPNHPWRAAGLFNGMIAPITPYAVRGAIWYQGESNAGRAYQYRELFPAMIRDWREAWNNPRMPFFFVQLANFMDRQPEPGDSAWAELREAQSMTLSLPYTGQAVAIDIGEAKDIHPRNKQDVGKRLALAALATVYGEDVEYSGPVYKSMKVEGQAIRVSFTHKKGLAAQGGGALKGFAIAGADKKFVWAEAVIDGDEIVVSSPAVPNPVAVRYGWADNPEVNLVNGAGLPASPFRTDDWPGITVGKVEP